MTRITRRDFLRTIAAGVGAFALNQLLAGCRHPQPATDTEELFLETSPVTAVASVSKTTLEPAQVGAGVDLVVARGSEPEELVRRSIEALGGMERFVSKGDTVVIKPNICVAYHSFEYAATTNPWVVGTLVSLALAAGAYCVKVMDNPFGGTANAAYLKSGIQEQVLAAGGEMVQMGRLGFVKTDFPEGIDIRDWQVYKEVLDANVVINVPIAKHHSLARLTLGMKNLMGVIENRAGLHRNLGQRLADLTSRIRPALTVVDAVRILVANGPTGGNLDDVKELNTIIASPDIVAADSYAASLFDLKPEDLAFIRTGAVMGLGRSDLHNLHIEEVTVGG